MYDFQERALAMTHRHLYTCLHIGCHFWSTLQHCGVIAHAKSIAILDQGKYLVLCKYLPRPLWRSYANSSPTRGEPFRRCPDRRLLQR